MYIWPQLISKNLVMIKIHTNGKSYEVKFYRCLSLLVNYFCTQFENVTLKTNWVITSQQNCWWTDGQCDDYYRAPPFSCEALNIDMIHKEKNFSLYAHEECSLRIKCKYIYIANLSKLDITEIVTIWPHLNNGHWDESVSENFALTLIYHLKNFFY